MPFPKRFARFNRGVTNRVIPPLARRMPGFGIVLHKGRRTGRSYRTPVNAFQTPDGYVIALSYGSDSDWVQNVLAADGCALETRGRTVALFDPQIVRQNTHSDVPRFVRGVLRLIATRDFMELRRRGA